jgi:hypothetical protein
LFPSYDERKINGIIKEYIGVDRYCFKHLYEVYDLNSIRTHNGRLNYYIASEDGLERTVDQVASITTEVSELDDYLATFTQQPNFSLEDEVRKVRELFYAQWETPSLECRHEMKVYQGFSESYLYCTKCDHKEKQ